MNMIPDKKEFKRAEVEGITSLSGNVLDYWEKKFKSFVPQVINDEKIYKYKDIQTILKIKQFLTVDRLNDNEIIERLSKETDMEQPIEKNTELQSSENKTKEIEIKEEIKRDEKKIKEKIKPDKIKENTIKVSTNPDTMKKNNEISNNKNKIRLKRIKDELLDILTILENSDKNRD